MEEQIRPLPRWYRVEHRHQAGVRALGRVEDGFAHFSALDPFLAQLPPDARGEVVLVDEATGAAVARRHLGSWRRRPGRRRPPTRPAAGPARRAGRHRAGHTDHLRLGEDADPFGQVATGDGE